MKNCYMERYKVWDDSWVGNICHSKIGFLGFMTYLKNKEEKLCEI